MGISPIIIGSLASAGIGAVASMSAANTQSSAAKGIAANQLTAGKQAAGAMDPYVSNGLRGIDLMNSNMGYLTTPYAPTLAQLQATPGYQFSLDQGLKATQNSAVSRGLGSSGAALKGAADYATGLAQSTYASQAQIYQQNQMQLQNFLTQMVSGGQSAASSQGDFLLGGVNAAGQTALSGAQAQAAGTVGAANAFTGGLTSATSAYYQSQILNALLAQNGAKPTASGMPSMMGF